jgi:hypothetical protein
MLVLSIIISACSGTPTGALPTEVRQSTIDTTTTATAGFISEQSAIAIASKIAFVGDDHVSGTGEPPKNTQATLASLAAARKQLVSAGWNDNLPAASDKMVWFVTMDGLWMLTGGPPPPLTPVLTIPAPKFTHYLVILDAQTGKVLFTTPR